MFAGFAFGFFILSNMAHLIRQKEFICKETIVYKKTARKFIRTVLKKHVKNLFSASVNGERESRRAEYCRPFGGFGNDHARKLKIVVAVD